MPGDVAEIDADAGVAFTTSCGGDDVATDDAMTSVRGPSRLDAGIEYLMSSTPLCGIKRKR